MDYWIKIFKIKYKKHNIVVIVYLDVDDKGEDILVIRSMGNEYIFTEQWEPSGSNRDVIYEMLLNLTEVWAAKWFERMYITIVEEV